MRSVTVSPSTTLFGRNPKSTQDQEKPPAERKRGDGASHNTRKRKTERHGLHPPGIAVVRDGANNRRQEVAAGGRAGPGLRGGRAAADGSAGRGGLAELGQ